MQGRSHNLRKAEIDREENVYQSKVFYIRYSEERVNFGEICKFKTEIESLF